MTRFVPQRRRFLVFSAAALLAGGTSWRGARAQAATGAAVAFVKKTGEQLVAVVNGAGSNAQKRQDMTRIINTVVDVDSVARFCLGRFWREATPVQQQRYVEMFHEVLVTNITAKLGDYKGVTFTVNRSTPDGDNVSVDTTVQRPNNPPTNVQWIIANASSDPKIVDVVAEGTSMRLTQRNDYTSYLVHNNNSIDALISAMRQQLEQNAASG
jgi:phospholipid transport system substrate-binding protein